MECSCAVSGNYAVFGFYQSLIEASHQCGELHGRAGFKTAANGVVKLFGVEVIFLFREIDHGAHKASFHFHQHDTSPRGLVFFQVLLQRFVGQVLQVNVEGGNEVAARLGCADVTAFYRPPDASGDFFLQLKSVFPAELFVIGAFNTGEFFSIGYAYGAARELAHRAVAFVELFDDESTLVPALPYKRKLLELFNLDGIEAVGNEGIPVFFEAGPLKLCYKKFAGGSRNQPRQTMGQRVDVAPVQLEVVGCACISVDGIDGHIDG